MPSERRVGEAVARKLPSGPNTFLRPSSCVSVCSGQLLGARSPSNSTAQFSVPCSVCVRMAAAVLLCSQRSVHNAASIQRGVQVWYWGVCTKRCSGWHRVSSGTRTCKFDRPAKAAARSRALTSSFASTRRRSDLHQQQACLRRSRESCTASETLHT